MLNSLVSEPHGENDETENYRSRSRLPLRGLDAHRQPRGHFLRALRILKEADLIACEDTRQTLKLLSHFDIQKRLVSYHEHNEITRAAELVIDLEQGAKVALVSDAGTPAISDPGHRLVSLCVRHGIQVVPVPGASAFVAALAASGMPTEEFAFIGFLPSRPTGAEQDAARVWRQSRARRLYTKPRTACLKRSKTHSKFSATGPR